MSTPTKFDDTYYNDQPVGWEVMFAWDNSFKEYIILVHPDHGTIEIHDEERVQFIKKTLSTNMGNFSL